MACAGRTFGGNPPPNNAYYCILSLVDEESPLKQVNSRKENERLMAA
jgi:hypothetical protein